MGEHVSNLGYVALKKQTAAKVAVTPDTYVPAYKESMTTELNHVDDTPVYGGKFKRFQTIKGQRSHKGGITVLAEPNSAALFLDMLLNKTGTTGAGPYTHAFALNTTDPNYYTVDISLVSQVVRFFGVAADKITPSFNGNEMQLDLTLAALGSFYGRTIASVAAAVITLDTTYDPNPTTGLVVGDLVRVVHADGTTADSTITALTATTVTTAADLSAGTANGDMFVLRPASVSLNDRYPFTWARTQFCFGTTAAAALSAAHTPLDEGSAYELMHNFDSEDGAKRSGSFDPDSLIRTVGDATFKVKKYFDKPSDVQSFNLMSKSACVIRHFSESGYELRVTLNNLTLAGGAKPNLESGKVLLAELEFAVNYDRTDGQGFDVKAINNIATV